MYRYLRNTHLFLGLFCCLFLFTYGASSIQMAHNKWFNTKAAVSVQTVALPAAQGDARVVARELTERLGIRGELAQIRPGARDLRFALTRPGMIYQVVYRSATGETEIRGSRSAFMFVLNRIHQMSGVQHNYWLTNAWGVLVIVVSVSLILIGATGIYLWFKIRRERMVGILLLAVSLGYSLSLLAMVRMSW